MQTLADFVEQSQGTISSASRSFAAALDARPGWRRLPLLADAFHSGASSPLRHSQRSTRASFAGKPLTRWSPSRRSHCAKSERRTRLLGASQTGSSRAPGSSRAELTGRKVVPGPSAGLGGALGSIAPARPRRPPGRCFHSVLKQSTPSVEIYVCSADGQVAKEVSRRRADRSPAGRSGHCAVTGA